MVMVKPYLSVVIPVYNSANTLQRLVEELNSALKDNCSYELILVDDGSSDQSWIVLEKVKQAYPEHLTAIRLSRNFGQHNAIACGIGFAKGDFILTMDDDLQHPPSEITKLLAHQKETQTDVVYGDYIDKRHESWRNAGSWFLRKSSTLSTGNHQRASSFRLIRRELAVKAISHLQGGFIFIDEILHWYTASITSTPVQHHQRREGRSAYSFAKLLRIYFDIVVNYSAIPLRWMTYIGLFSAFITFLLGVRFIYNKLMHGSSVAGFTATIVAILFSTSILMLCMGIIGQYLYKLYQIQNKRPPFSIERIL